MANEETEPTVPRETSGPMTKAVEAVVAKWRHVDCGACGQSFATSLDPAPEHCPPCAEHARELARLEAEATRVIQNAERWVERWALRTGMSAREVTAEVVGVPASLARMLRDPRLSVVAMVNGVTPERGFGLVGATGTGKTFALAAILKSMAASRWKRLAAVEGMRATKQFARWVRWPEVVAEFRFRSMRDGGMAEVERTVAEWADVEVLVVDDLGAERARGDYSEDWTSSLLDLVVDRRYNAMRPTWWTANLAPEEMVQRYGTRLWSRLTGQNPALVVPTVPDLRVVGTEKGGNDAR